jgi:hypothetical protein
MRLENRIKRMEQQLGSAAQSADAMSLEETLAAARDEIERRYDVLKDMPAADMEALVEDNAQALKLCMDAAQSLSAALPGPDGDKWRDKLKAMEQAELEALKSELDSMAPGPGRHLLEHLIRAKEQIRNNEKTLP